MAKKKAEVGLSEDVVSKTMIEEATDIVMLYGPISRGMKGMMRDFIMLYDGDGYKCAVAAGIGASNPSRQNVTISNFLADKRIKDAIEEKVQYLDRIANSDDRKKFWTKVMYDKKAKMTDRLKASELLGKASGDFSENDNRALTIVFLGNKNMVSIGGESGKVIEAVASGSAEQDRKAIQST